MQKNRVQVAFGHAMRHFRTRAGISQERLAELAELHRTYIGSIERGERNVSIVNIWKVAQAMHIRATELVREMERHLRK